jgi:hypothetical protein
MNGKYAFKIASDNKVIFGILDFLVEQSISSSFAVIAFLKDFSIL